MIDEDMGAFCTLEKLRELSLMGCDGHPLVRDKCPGLTGTGLDFLNDLPHLRVTPQNPQIRSPSVAG